MIKRELKKKKNEVKVTFSLPHEDVESHGNAVVVGDFNNWDPSANKLKKRSNGTYSTSVQLAGGSQFAFRYFFEDGTWKNEDEADETALSPFGTENSVLNT